MISREAALGFKDASGDEFDDFLAKASEVRDRHWGKTLTYSRKVFIPLTNMCRDDCGYCVFVKRPRTREARYMTPDEVLRVTEEGKRLGCKEALFSLGERPETRYQEARDALHRLGYSQTIDYLRDMCESVARNTGLIPHANPGTLSEEEIRKLKPVTGSMGIMLESISERLLQRGEAHYRCPDKVPGKRLETLAIAGRHDVPFTTGILIGIGETWEERLDALFAIDRIHREYGHIQEVIVQNFRAKQGIAMVDHPEPTHIDMMRTIAVTRLVIDPSISVQAPPNLQDRYAEYIGAGLNDWGGISPLTIDHINPERAWPQICKLRQRCLMQGYDLQERLAVYPKFLKDPERYLDRGMREPLLSVAGNNGMAKVQSLS